MMLENKIDELLQDISSHADEKTILAPSEEGEKGIKMGPYTLVLAPLKRPHLQLMIFLPHDQSIYGEVAWIFSLQLQQNQLYVTRSWLMYGENAFQRIPLGESSDDAAESQAIAELAHVGYMHVLAEWNLQYYNPN